MLGTGLTSSKLLLAVDTGDGVKRTPCVCGAVFSDASAACDSDITCACATLLCPWTVPG